MHAPMKYVEKGLAIAANGVWQVFSPPTRSARTPPSRPSGPTSRCSSRSRRPSRRSAGRAQTDSLCPTCVREARQAILDGKQDVSILLNEKVGEIKATIIERDGKILMVKDCPIHGHFEDVMAIDTAVLQAPRGGRSRAATSARTTTRSCTTTAAAPSSTAAARC